MKIKYLCGFAFLSVFIAAATAGYAAKFEEDEISWSDVPAAVQETIQSKVDRENITEIVKKTVRGNVYYEFEVQDDSKELDYSVDSEGKFLGIEGEGHDYKGVEREEGGEADEKAGEDEDGEADDEKAADKNGWMDSFKVDRKDFTPTGRNRYFILEPGHQIVLKSKKETVEITVLNDTRLVDGVVTRVIQERESKNGKLVEVSRNYFAVDRKTNDIYYFGEEVDMYKNGKISGHEGAWLSGVDGARYGLIMPAKPTVGFKHYQEIAPEMAMDRAEIVSVSDTFQSSAGTFEECLKVDETSPLEPGEHSIKVYAPGIGMVKDGAATLVKHGMVKSGRKK